MFWLLVGLRATLALASCDVEPISLPIQDVQVDPNTPRSFMRGIPAKIGTPSQNIVMLPWAELNNTWIYDETPNCDSSVIWNDKICEIRRGSLFHVDESTSFTKATDIVAAGGASEEITTAGTEAGMKKLISTGVGGTDRFEIGSVALNKTPIGIPKLRWDNGYTMLHALGLGANSTYLNSLAQAGSLGSRVWSIFWGRMWTTNNIDGSLVLGGYDSEKVTGKNFTQRLDYSEATGCWTGMKVTITDIQVNFRDGIDESIMPINNAIPCCIVPHRHMLLGIPRPIVDNFQNVTNIQDDGLSFGIHWGARKFDAKAAFDGDITLFLSSGLQVRVPNSQYIVPFVDIDRSGAQVIDNKVKELLMTGLAFEPATLGRYFLTSAYLMIDHDMETFTLWQANPTNRSSLVKVASDSSDCGKPQTSRDAINPTSTPTNGPDDSSNSEAGPNTSTLAGTIAGIAVSGALILAVIGLGVFFRLRSKKQNASQSQTPPYNTEPSAQVEPVQEALSKCSGQQEASHEAHGSQGHHRLSELRGQDNFVFEMDGGNDQRT